ncbi:MAG: hypothetical protein EKK40_15595 [Bradyrhizobiaceae bacterium]|nr:MAG: hypothetical protein EKK40_15595 [Bradyrhizobiaceae bacterium]
MLFRDDAFARHQRMRWLRPDAGRWVREDAARFLRPGSGQAEVVAGIERKYNQDQPRVPAGNGRESGRWTDGSSGGAGNDVAQPMGSIDFGDLPNFSDLFQIAPSEYDNSNFTQLAGDIPDGEGSSIGQNQGPSLEPPEIPAERPITREERMTFARSVATWVTGVGRRAAAVDLFFEAADQVSGLKGLLDAGKSAADPPASLEELQERATLPSQSGYQKHHIVERAAALEAGYPKSLVDGRDNLASIPVLKHIDITIEYQRNDFQPDGTFRSLREYLQDKDFETRRNVGLAIMRKHGVLK